MAAGALLGVPVASYLRPLEPSEASAAAELAPDELEPWDARLVLVSGRPLIVVRTDEGYQALSAVCTHLGCIVKWKKARKQFFCPCHGGRFALDGRVLGGPAPAPLARASVEEGPEKVVVRLA